MNGTAELEIVGGKSRHRIEARLRALFPLLLFLTIPLHSRAQWQGQHVFAIGPSRQCTLPEALTVFVREFRFLGNTVFSNVELAKIVRGYVGIRIDTGDLENARLALTKHYVSHGYINSGALLDDQPVGNGIITFRIVEGKLSEIDIQGNQRLRTPFIQSRIERWAGAPLNAHQLQDSLLILKDNPNLKRLNAELRPGAARGESLLDLQVEERNPWRLGVQSRNDRPPSVGAEVVEILAAHENVTGNSDRFDIRYGLLQRSSKGMTPSGFENVGLSYRIPVHPSDTWLDFSYSRNDYAVIEEPFDSLNIDSQSDSYGIGLTQPLLKTPSSELSLSLVADRRHSETFLLSEPFSFSAGAVDGKTTVSALRCAQQFAHRSQAQVLALRSSFHWGVDLLGSSDDGSDRDGKFLSWIGQILYVRRLGDSANQFMLSSGVQWSADPLLSLEQFSLGGAHTVRGYRENQLVRDMGFVAAVEFRLPIFCNKSGAPVLQLAPFIDYGRGWNIPGLRRGHDPLFSTGIGLVVTPNNKFHGELYWGHRFQKAGDTDGDDLQDLGVHFKVVLMAF